MIVTVLLGIFLILLVGAATVRSWISTIARYFLCLVALFVAVLLLDRILPGGTGVVMMALFWSAIGLSAWVALTPPERG